MAAARVLQIESVDSTLLGQNRALDGDIKNSIGVSENISPENLIKLISHLGLKHVVQRQGPAFDTELIAARTMIQDARAFLDDPMRVIFNRSPALVVGPVLELRLEVTDSKKDVLNEVGNFIATVKGARSIWDQALMVTDELFTNGAKLAWPETGKLFAGKPTRTGRLEIFVRNDQDRLVIGCRDSFGELDVKTVVERIKTCFENGLGSSIRHGTVGAGIGSFMIFDACSGYYAGTEVGKRTVVCVAFPLGMSHRVRAELPKNIHLLA